MSWVKKMMSVLKPPLGVDFVKNNKMGAKTGEIVQQSPLTKAAIDSLVSEEKIKLNRYS